jgi:hypothetical protein
VAYLLKARTVEQEKQPSLANDSETTCFYATAAKQTTEQRPLIGSRFLINMNRRLLLRERLGKHVAAATDIRMILSAKAVLRSHEEDNWGDQVSSVWEAVKRGLECRS